MKKTLLLFFFFTLSPILFCQESNDCKKYHTGFFEFEGKHSNTIVYRKGNYQIEYNIKNGEWVTIGLNWITNCKYSFTYISTNMPGLKDFIGYTMIVDIVKCNKEGYFYHSKGKEDNIEYTGKIIFLMNELDSIMKKKIKRKLKETKT